MTIEEFIEELSYTEYSYEIVGGKINVTTGDEEGDFIMYLPSIPPDVIFSNPGYVELNYIDNVPSGAEFNNKGHVFLSSVNVIEKDVYFNNDGGVYLKSIFNGWSDYCDFKIDGIDSKRLLNLMIKQGLFI